MQQSEMMELKVQSLKKNRAGSLYAVMDYYEHFIKYKNFSMLALLISQSALH